jgi:predicted dehydrogenase
VKKVKVGIIGCGKISAAYFKGCKAFQILDVAACSDINMACAEEAGKEYGCAAVQAKDMLANPEIEIVVNLTIPKVHAEVDIAALEAGKHVYSEKPLSVSREEGKKVLDVAKRKGLLVTCAPDTFMGGGGQTARKVIDDGWIGQPVAATAFFASHGPEGWHPNPAFLYHHGAGPMLDIGPYYITAMVNLMGPITRVTGSTRITFPERMITSQPLYGTMIKVEAPTLVSGVMDFASGAIASIIASFDIWSHTLPRIEVHGTEGSMVVPDPNTFTGQVMVKRAGAKEWSNIPHSHSDTVSRGIGVADLAYAVRCGRKPRPSAELAYHVLDVMCAFEEAGKAGEHVQIKSTVERPAPLPLGLMAGTLDG